MVIRLLIIAEVSLYREALARSLGCDERFYVAAVAAGINEALASLDEVQSDIILVDAGMPVSANAVWMLATAAPEVKVVALGVPEVRREVMALAEAGVSGYVTSMVRWRTSQRWSRASRAAKRSAPRE